MNQHREIPVIIKGEKERIIASKVAEAMARRREENRRRLQSALNKLAANYKSNG